MFPPRPGVLAITTGLSAEAGRPYILYMYKWSNFPKMQLTWQHGCVSEFTLSEAYITLRRKTKTVLPPPTTQKGGGGCQSTLKTCIIVLSTSQGVCLFMVSLQSKEPLTAIPLSFYGVPAIQRATDGYTWALMSSPRPASLPNHLHQMMEHGNIINVDIMCTTSG